MQNTRAVTPWRVNLNFSPKVKSRRFLRETAALIEDKLLYYPNFTIRKCHGHGR